MSLTANFFREKIEFYLVEDYELFIIGGYGNNSYD
jgi:hypothetical protein